MLVDNRPLGVEGEDLSGERGISASEQTADDPASTGPHLEGRAKGVEEDGKEEQGTAVVERRGRRLEVVELEGGEEESLGSAAATTFRRERAGRTTELTIKAMALLPKSWKKLGNEVTGEADVSSGQSSLGTAEGAHVSDGSALSLWKPRRRQSLIWPP